MRITYPLLAGAIALCAVGAVAAQSTCEGTPGEAQLHIVISGVHGSTGLMTASLYGDDEAHFLKSKGSLKVWRAPAVSPQTTMCIWLPHPGAYEIAIYQDLDANMKWDHAAFGSIEPFGFSRNPTIFFSAPSLSSTRFQAPAGDTTIRVRLNHR